LVSFAFSMYRFFLGGGNPMNLGLSPFKRILSH
jgi:hypothetical protein